MNADQEMRLAGESQRGAQAKRLLEDSMLQEAFAVVEADTLEKWKTSPVRDQEGQLALRLKWQCLQEVKKHLRDVAMTGKMADETIRQEMSIRARMRQAGATTMDAARGFVRMVKRG